MTRLLDEIKSEPPNTRGRRSIIDGILAQLSPDDAADLQTALDDHLIPQVSISRVMAARGFKLTSSVISRYRNGGR